MKHIEYLSIPEHSQNIQLANKIIWNQIRSRTEADFYTISYAGRTINQFTSLLKEAGVVTVVDIRQNAVSPYKPEFSKNRIQQFLEKNEIQYNHRPDLGVPREIRATAIGRFDRTAIWEWYDASVLSTFIGNNLDNFFNSVEHPVAFMCVETDPFICHRHRLALALERHGLNDYDL